MTGMRNYSWRTATELANQPLPDVHHLFTLNVGMWSCGLQVHSTWEGISRFCVVKIEYSRCILHGIGLQDGEGAFEGIRSAAMHTQLFIMIIQLSSDQTQAQNCINSDQYVPGLCAFNGEK